MGIYTKDAIKEIAPNETLLKCTDIFEEFDFQSLTISHELYERKHEMFGIYTSNFSINPHGLFKLFPEKFPYLEGKEDISYQVSNGKGLSKEQCFASMYMEMLERLSIKLFEQKVKTLGEEIRKSFSRDDYFAYLTKNAPYLSTHFKDKKFDFKLSENKVDYLNVVDIVNNKTLYFPTVVLFDSMGTNGFTAGNTDEEAITGGIFEVVERYTQTLFCTDEIKASKVAIPSIISAYPELKNSLEKSNDYFDKYDVVDVSITIKGVKFYSYFIRTEFEKTGHKMFSSGGCHLDQRIALIRAVSEGIQGIVEGIEDASQSLVRNQGWGTYRLFSKYFIERIYGKIDSLTEVPIQVDKVPISSIHEIYEKSVLAFEHILVLDCTNENFKTPTFIIYIPELFSKTYIWPVLFHVGIDIFKGKIISESIEGLECLFFWDDTFLDNAEEIERKKLYHNLIYNMHNKEVGLFISSVYPNFKKEISSNSIKHVTFFDDDDPESFVHFNANAKQNNKADYLFESYAKMGCIGLGKSLLDTIKNQDVVSTYLNKYDNFGEYLLENDEYERALVVYRQLVEVSDDDNYMEKYDELKLITDKAFDLKMSIFDNKKPSIFGLSYGDVFEEFILTKIVEEGMFQFELTFELESQEFTFTLHTVEQDDYYAKSKTGLYIDHLYDILSKKEKKFIKKLLKMINVY